MKLAERELWIDGKLSILDGFDWKTNEAIYRQAVDGEAVYVRVPLEKNNPYFVQKFGSKWQ